MGEILVSDIMTREPVTISPDSNLLLCAKNMVRKRVGSLAIVVGKRLVGFISQQDILWALIKKSKEDLPKIKAIDISPKKIATIKPNATINEALLKMKRLKFERLPVIQDKEFVGIITVKDILNFHPEFYPEIDEFKKIKEESEKLNRIKNAGKRITSYGICEECGNYGSLEKIHGIMVCENCMDI